MSPTRRRDSLAPIAPPNGDALPRLGRHVSEPLTDLGDADTTRYLEKLRVAVYGQDPSVYARLDRTAARPRLLVGDEPRRVVMVTPPLNDRDTSVFRWGQWGGRIAPVAKPETAAAAVLAVVQKGGRP